MSVLVTGGSGYIGSHVLVALAEAGRECVCLDNHSNSSPIALDRVRQITGKAVTAYDADIRDGEAVARILGRHPEIDSVIHLAGLKAVAESLDQPARYHDNNVRGTQVLLDALAPTKVRRFVFSSSATVYGAARTMPITESQPLAPTNPYGQNKVDVEQMLERVRQLDPAWRIVNLRYFNPVGAHPSGLIGEDPKGVPNNLMPYLCQAAAGRLPELRIFGDDYPTRDGTGVRDYIHVADLAEGHLAALRAVEAGNSQPTITANLGTGRGVSVKDLIETFERVNSVAVPRRIVGRRPGDVAECYADASLAGRILGWKAVRGVDEMCRDAWAWQQRNPDGYR